MKTRRNNPTDDKIKLESLVKFNKLADLKMMETSIPVLDAVLKGGLQQNNVIQLVGESGIGKSTIAMQIASKLCLQDKKVLYIDSEGSISIELMKSTGAYEYINKNLFYVCENTFTKIEEVIDTFINTGEIQFVIVDSLACLIHEGFTDIESKQKISITTNNTNYISKKLCLFMHKYNALAKSKNICFILINQHRNQVDMKKGTILKIYGGKNVIYNTDIILRIKTVSSSNSDFKALVNSYDKGIPLEIEVVKSNRREPVIVPFYLIYGKGISKIISSIYVLVKQEIITKDSNGYYSHKKFKAHGINELVECYKQHLLDDVETQNQLHEYFNNL